MPSQRPLEGNKYSRLKEQFWNALSKGRFDLCYEIYKKNDYSTMFRILWVLAYDKSSLLPYAFVWYLLSKEETANIHGIGSFIFLHALVYYLPRGYELGLYHARRAMELEPGNIKNKERMLLFNRLPERPLSDEEAREIALEVLQKNPNDNFFKEQLEHIEARLEEKRKKKSKKA